MVEERDRSTYRFGGVVVAIFSALFFGAAIFLSTYCTPVAVSGDLVLCEVQHQLAAFVFGALGFILLLASLYLTISRHPEGWDHFFTETLAVHPESAPKKCRSCGNWSPPSTMVCGRCGSPLTMSDVS
jgi:uncharacterized paraquat-inducible protein A